MNTLLIHQAFASPKDAGGTRHFELGRYLVGTGDRFTIIASDLSYLTGKRKVEDKKAVAKQNISGVDILRAYTYPSLHRSFSWRVVSFLSFMGTSLLAALSEKDVDLVMGTTPPIFQAGSAWLVATLRRRPFLLEIRDLWPEFAIALGILTNPLLIKLSRWFEIFLYSQATHLLVNSPAYRDYLISKGVPESKITLIPNGVDATMFDPEAAGEHIREKYNLNGKFVVTYAGALGMANDIDTLLHAAVHLQNEPDIHFLLAGDGKERGRLEAAARKLCPSQVTFTGPFPKDEMRNVLAASNACVATLKDIPSFRTTYPNKVFDYMAAGRPIVLGIDGVIRQVVADAKAGIFVQPGDGAALADAVRNLYRNPEQAASMGMAGRLYVMEHFNRSKHAEDFARLVRRLAQVR
ncbi:MAG: glycosyltransferase family 4 protein [bacterium]